MFYNGGLSSGIAKALAESKQVACFVTDNGEESNLWENEFIQVSNLKNALAQQTVLLRLEAGSQEAGHLAAIYPLPKFPTFVLIQNGQLKEYIAAGVSREDFMRRMSLALTFPESQTTPQQAVQPSSAVAGGTSALSQNAHVEPEATVAPSSANNRPSSSTTRSAASPPSNNPVDILQVTDQAPEQPQLQATPSVQAQFSEYAQQQKKRQQEAKDERARILKRVQDDKLERKQRELKRKAAATSVGSSTTGADTTRPSSSNQCSLQIRLFDGSTIKSTFSPTGTLLHDVRPWIDSKAKLGAPYTFKHVLTPLPNKNISTSEESSSLSTLSLIPTATLILIPVSNSTSAYPFNQPTSVVFRTVSSIYTLIMSFFALLLSLFTSAPQGAPTESGGAVSGGRGGSVNMRTLRDQDDGNGPPIFYNGNATSFESRKDEEKNDE